MNSGLVNKILSPMVFMGGFFFLFQQTFAAPLCSKIFSDNSKTYTAPSLIKNIIDLPDNESVPQDIYEKFSTQDIARAIVQRVRQQEKRYANEIQTEPLVDLHEDTDLILFFQTKDLMSITQSGFKNQHETGTSNGDYVPKLRDDVEDNFTGIKMGQSSQAKELRPKSSFVNIRTKIELATKNSSEIKMYGYGEIGAVLKDSVKDRALWTFDDSATFGQQAGQSTGPYLAKYRGTFARGSISVATDIGKSFEVPHWSEIKFNRYYEGLIYGKISFADVEYFLVADKRQADFLRQWGIPIYLAKMVYRNQRTIFEKGGLLFEGTSLSKNPIQSLFNAIGIKENIETIHSWKVVTSFSSVSMATTKTADYLILSPGKVKSWFDDFINRYQAYSKDLNKLGIQTRRIIGKIGQYAVLDAKRDALFLDEVIPMRRKMVLEALKFTVGKLIENNVYLVLHPSLLLIDNANNLVVIGDVKYSDYTDNSQLRIIDAYIQATDNGWSKYFSDKEIENFKNWLKYLKGKITKNVS